MTAIRNSFAAGVALALLLGAVPVAPPPPAWASDADAYVQSAQTLTAKGDLKGAAIELRNAARTAPENADIHFQLAKIYLQISNLPAAEAEARIALQRGADEGKVAPILAEALLRTGKFDILLHDVPAGSRPPQQESAVRLFRGHAYLSLGQLSQAETLMREAEQLDPNAVGPKLGVARLLLAQNQPQAAEQKIDQALAINPKDSHAEISKADVLRMRGDLDGGLAYLNDVLSREPQNFSAHLGRANLLVAKNQLDVAGQEIRAILAEVPDDFQANYLQALIDARQNRLDQANARLQKFIPEFRDYPVGFLLLGDVQFAQGKLSEAEDNLTKFLGRVPNNPMATKLAAEIAIREGSLERASRYLEALLKVTPNDAGAWVLLANAYLAEGKNDEASQALTHATAMGTSDPNFEPSWPRPAMPRAGPTRRSSSSIRCSRKPAACKLPDRRSSWPIYDRTVSATPPRTPKPMRRPTPTIRSPSTFSGSPASPRPILRTRKRFSPASTNSIPIFQLPGAIWPRSTSRRGARTMRSRPTATSFVAMPRTSGV